MTIKGIIDLIGYGLTIVEIVPVVILMCLAIKGLLPVLYRLGIALAKRRIAIFASTKFGDLKDMLIDSKLFKEENIVQIHKDSLDRAASETFFLVHWKDYADKIDEILRLKGDSTALVVYAPQDEGKIDDGNLTKINLKRNALIVNLRGRLLNDIFCFLITTK